MRERPMLFNGAMVRAILSGRKTQTRRAIKPQPANDPARHHPIAPYHNGSGGWNWVLAATGHGTGDPFPCPFGQPGDRLWVRESFTDLRGTGIEHRPDPRGPLQRWAYSADTLPGSASDEARKDFGINWRPSIHMPREACRLVLEVTDVRVERLQAISEADAMAEGANPILVPPDGGSCPHIEGFRKLWASTGGDWAANPWVWVIGFRTAEGQANG
jgi:hypothetical protein